MTELRPDSAEGTLFRGQPRTLSAARIRAFSGGPLEMEGWPLVNIHTDLAHAQRCGLKKRNASGTQWQGYIIQMMLGMFGTSWLSHGTIETKFIRMVLEDDTVTPWASVTRSEPTEGGVRFSFDIGCENQRGETVLAGTATGILKIGSKG